jgi:DNA-binding transcriptional LysR family regulator
MAKSPSLLDLLSMLPAGDIARTARSLGLSPDLLRKRLDALESTLGVSLLGSATRALKPAETGKLVLEHAGRILSQARDFTRDLEELAGLQSPVLTFGADMFVAQLPLGVTLGRMITANSRLRARVVVADFDELARAVLASELEFGVADTAGAERHPTRLAIDPVAEYPLRFFARSGHPLAAGGAPPSLETILVFPLVMTRIPQRIAVHIAGGMPQARADRETGDLQPGLAVDDFAVAKLAVAAGDAVGLAPLPAIEAELRARKLVLVPFEAPWLHLSYGVFHPRKRALSRAAQLFVAQLRQVDAAIQARSERTRARAAATRAPGASGRGQPSQGRRKRAAARRERRDGR